MGYFTEEAELAAHQLPQQQGVGHRDVNFWISSSNSIPKKNPAASALSPELCKLIQHSSSEGNNPGDADSQNAAVNPSCTELT